MQPFESNWWKVHLPTKQDNWSTHERIHTGTCTHARIHTRTHVHTHVRTHARTYARTHAHMYARTHVRTHARKYSCLNQLVADHYKATTTLRDKTRIKHCTSVSTTPSATTLPKIGMHIQCFVRVVAQVTGPRRAGDSKNKKRRKILKTKLTNHKLRNWFVLVTSFVVRLQFWSSPYDRSSAAMAGFSQRQLAAFWSFQVLSTVLSAQNDAMEVMMHYYLQSSQFFSHLHV